MDRYKATMNLRRQRPSDSLDMLLDTMCNTFGGIILLAVLVTLLTSRERQIRSGTAADSQELLQRRLAMAQTNLQKSLQLSASLQAKADDEKWSKQITVLASRKELRDELERIREAISQYAKELETATAADPAERLKFLNSQLAAAQARKVEIQNSLAAAEKNTKRLKQRLDDLDKQAAGLISESQRPLRLPREYKTGKRVIYVVARYGRIYFCRNSDLSRNETDINWTSGLDSETAEPIPGKGIDPAPNAGGFKNFLNNQSRESIYLVYCVFEDSFPAFIRAKKMTVDAGFAYGWEAFRNQDGPVSFGSLGHTPKPQ
jgi:hypothetical protein